MLHTDSILIKVIETRRETKVKFPSSGQTSWIRQVVFLLDTIIYRMNRNAMLNHCPKKEYYTLSLLVLRFLLCFSFYIPSLLFRINQNVMYLCLIISQRLTYGIALNLSIICNRACELILFLFSRFLIFHNLFAI